MKANAGNRRSSPGLQSPQPVRMSNVQSEADVKVLEVTELRKYFPILRGFFRRQVGEVKAVDDVSFHVEPRRDAGACGRKRLRQDDDRPLRDEGHRAFQRVAILFRKRDGEEIDITTLTQAATCVKFRQHMGMIFQDPFSSLNPRLTVLEIIGEPFVTRKLVKGRRELEERVARAVCGASASTRPTCGAIPMPSAGVNASVLPLHAPWPWTRTSSSQTNLCRRWMYRYRPRFSACSRNCKMIFI